MCLSSRRSPVLALIPFGVLLLACSPSDVKIECPTGTTPDGRPPPLGRKQACRKTMPSESTTPGVRHGPALSWHLNGEVESEEHYVDDRLEGRAHTFHNNGKRASRRHYAQGKKTGVWETWSAAGIRLSRYEYRSDQLHGVQKDYFPDGRIKLRERFRGGLRDGPSTRFHASGERHLAGPFTNGKKHGQWLEGANDGGLKGVFHYKDGQRVAAPETAPSP